MKKSNLPLDLAAQVAYIESAAQNLPPDEKAWVDWVCNQSLKLGRIPSVDLLIKNIEKGIPVRGEINAYPQGTQQDVDKVTNWIEQIKGILPPVGKDGISLGNPLTGGPNA